MIEKRPFVRHETRSALSRKGDIGVECSEGLLPAISTSGGVAAKLRFRVCSGGHAGAHGAGVGGVMLE